MRTPPGPARPDYSLERAAGARVAGIDEVGRGCWAGPVAAAAVLFGEAGPPAPLCATVLDSKRLSPAQRTALYDRILACAAVGIGMASVAEIDRLNILQASLLAMERAAARLDPAPAFALVDGNRTPERLPCPARAVVGGDGRSLSVAAASIVAKVVRDRLMARLAAAHPGYGWERNAGYGTRAHREGLAQLGPTAHHRRSFRPIRALAG